MRTKWRKTKRKLKRALVNWAKAYQMPEGYVSFGHYASALIEIERWGWEGGKLVEEVKRIKNQGPKLQEILWPFTCLVWSNFITSGPSLWAGKSQGDTDLDKALWGRGALAPPQHQKISYIYHYYYCIWLLHYMYLRLYIVIYTQIRIMAELSRNWSQCSNMW